MIFKMKVVAILAAALMTAAGADGDTKETGDVLAQAEPLISQLLVSPTGVADLINKTVGDLGGYRHAQNGTITLKGTQLVLDYSSPECLIIVRKRSGRRFIVSKYAYPNCKANVCENKYTKVCKSCRKFSIHRAAALNCALKANIKALDELAKEAVDSDKTDS